MIQPFFKNTQKFITKTAAALSEKIKEAKEPEKEMKESTIQKMFTRGEKREVVDISVSSVTKSALAIAGVALLLYALFYIKDILLLFFISIFFAAALDPFITRMESRNVPRWLGAVLIYLIIFAVFGLLIALIIPIILTQIPKIAEAAINTLVGLFPNIEINTNIINTTAASIQQYLSGIDIQQISGTNVNSIVSSASTVLSETWNNALNIITAIGGGIFNVVLIMVIVFFLVLDKKGLGSFFTSLFPSRYTPYIQQKAYAIQKKIGEWLVGQLLLCLSIGVLTYIGLSILGVENALTLALIGGITEFIPYLGPILAGIPTLLVALAQDGMWLTIWALVVIFIVQQLENNVLVPLIMKKSVGLSPVATMFAMMIGYQLLGILGMILAVPIATSAGIFISDYSHREK